MALINDILAGKSKHVFVLIDPGKQDINVEVERAKKCEEYGVTAIMVGGSTNEFDDVNDYVKAIRDAVNIPVIQFPNKADVISPNVEYIFFMTLFNALDTRWIVGEQMKGSPKIKEYGIKPISMGYLIISTSSEETTVEKMVKLDKITNEDVDKAVSYAVAMEHAWNLSCIYLEAGSGAEEPVADEIIKAVRANVDMPVIVGGGIMDAEVAKKKFDAGADVIVLGTLVEKKGCGEVKKIIEKIS